MSKIEKTLFLILSGNCDNNISFLSTVNLLKHLGFSTRIKGDHHIFYMDSIEEIINIQPLGNKCKAYQVKQIRKLIHKYRLNK